MDASASAAHANLLEPNVLELIHQMEVWYATALQQQGDESGNVAQGLLRKKEQRPPAKREDHAEEGDGSQHEADEDCAA